MKIGAALKRAGVPSVLGGPVTTQDGNAWVSVLAPFFETLVVGEAEPVLADLLLDVAAGTPKPTYRSRGYPPLTNVPFPRFDLLDLGMFTRPHVFPVQTARGCPHACSYCSEQLYGPWRYRPVDAVLSELRQYPSRLGASRLVFRDDDFLVHHHRSRALLPELKQLDVEWACQTDLSLSRHLDIVDLAVDAGLRAICFGLESIDPENRREIGKTFFRLDEIGPLLARLHDLGVEIQMSTIFGLDHDTPEVFDETVDFMLANNVSFFWANILSPEAGTGIHQKLAREGRLIETPPLPIDDPEISAISGLRAIRRSFLEVEDPALISFRPRHLTAEQLIDLTRHARDRFEAERTPTVWIPEKSEY